MREFLSFIAKHMVDNPDQVAVKEITSSNTVVLELSVAKQDLGKIIGVKGRNIGAIRTLMTAISGKIRKQIIIELIE